MNRTDPTMAQSLDISLRKRRYHGKSQAILTSSSLARLSTPSPSPSTRNTLLGLKPESRGKSASHSHPAPGPAATPSAKSKGRSSSSTPPHTTSPPRSLCCTRPGTSRLASPRPRSARTEWAGRLLASTTRSRRRRRATLRAASTLSLRACRRRPR
jgi:hypothetical protein